MFSFLTLQHFTNKNTQLKWLKYILKKGKNKSFLLLLFRKGFFFLEKAFFAFGQLNLLFKKKKKSKTVKLLHCSEQVRPAKAS